MKNEIYDSKILEFHDLFPEENDLDERVLLTKYNREYIVRCCHVLCNNYGNAAFIPDTKNTFFQMLVRSIFPT